LEALKKRNLFFPAGILNLDFPGRNPVAIMNSPSRIRIIKKKNNKWNVKTGVIPVIIGATGTISKSLKNT
jgi:hypothetical protein